MVDLMSLRPRILRTLRHSVGTLYTYALQQPNQYVFVSHGGSDMVHVDAMCEFLTALGLIA
jgi:hypothetical protein